MSKAPPLPRLLLVTDRHRARLPLPELAARAIQGGVDVVQVREKDLSTSELLSLCSSVLDAIGDPSRLMVNGSPSVSTSLGIGLHVPESKIEAIRIRPSELTLCSRAFHAESTVSDLTAFNFAIVGHVFETGGKAGRPPLGLDRLRIIAQGLPIPVLAIGGMTPERVASVLSTGAKGVAVLSAINESFEPENVAASFEKALEKAMSEQKQELMSITLNGKPVTIPRGTTVTGYLASRNFHERMVVVELNGTILPKKEFEETVLTAGDKVEIVHFVGGG